jgi:glutamate-1-semialdehyde 2,1-aminomutase
MNQVFYNESDRIVWEEDLEDFIPYKIFDAHVHFWDDSFLPLKDPQRNNFVNSGLQITERWNKQMFPGRDFDYLVFGMPLVNADIKANNEFVVSELAGKPNSRKNRLVTPECKTEDIYNDVVKYNFVGMKPYRQFSTTGDINQCRIQDFLTHPQMELANEMGLFITLHLSRYHGCADEQNLIDLEEYTTKKYPNIKWILAHCARSFTYWPLQKAINRLRQIPNIWYDISAVSDVMAQYTLLSKEDHRRILYGSDNFTANAFHGRYVAMGRFWYQIGTPEYAKKNNIHTNSKPILAIYEQLLAFKHAAQLAQLRTEQINDVFYNNAKKLFDLKSM